MSQATLDIMNQHRADQIEISPSSETFQIVGGATFKGIFDRAHVEENKDGGNITQKKLTPLIMVSSVPAGLVERSSKITRETAGKEYTFRIAGLDAEGIPILWLY